MRAQAGDLARKLAIPAANVQYAFARLQRQQLLGGGRNQHAVEIVACFAHIVIPKTGFGIPLGLTFMP